MAPRRKTDVPEVPGGRAVGQPCVPTEPPSRLWGIRARGPHRGEAAARQVLLDSRGRRGRRRRAHLNLTHGVGSPLSSIQTMPLSPMWLCFTWGMRNKSFNPIEAWFSNPSSSLLIYITAIPHTVSRQSPLTKAYSFHPYSLGQGLYPCSAVQMWMTAGREGVWFDNKESTNLAIWSRPLCPHFINTGKLHLLTTGITDCIWIWQSFHDLGCRGRWRVIRKKAGAGEHRKARSSPTGLWAPEQEALAAVCTGAVVS